MNNTLQNRMSECSARIEDFFVKAFEKTTGKPVKYKIAPRRDGDIATCYSNPKKAEEELNWKAEKTLEDMCRDSWKFIELNSK